MKKSLLFLFVSVVSFTFSQTYSKNREKFVKEFQTSIAEYGKGYFQEFAKKDLPFILLETNEFSEAYFTQMITTSNLMVTKKLKPYPDVFNYVFSVYSLVKNKQSDNSFKAWHNTVDQLLANRNLNKFEGFIEFSAGFFSERSIAVSSNYTWYFVGGTYAFEYTTEPTVVCENGTLSCRIINKKHENNPKEPKYTDSIVVNNTSGKYDPIEKKWIGKGGSINWEKVGLPKNETFASVKTYNVSCKTPNLTADSVALTTKYFSKPILGNLSEHAMTINREEDRIYPKFVSFEKKLKIPKIVENIDYIGGFSMNGASFIGQGTITDPASIVVYRNNLKFIKVSAQLIDVSPKKVLVNNAEMSLYLNTGDSIYHPGIKFDYDIEKKDIQLVRTASGNGQAPFNDKYHMLDIYVQKIAWNTNNDFLEFTFDYGTSQEQRIARFESKSYFDSKLYDKLQGLSPVHPLVAIHQYTYKYDEYILPEGKVASAMNLTIDQAKPIMLELANYGFISYDTESKKVIVNPKTENFVLGKVGKRDYDNIIFVSDMRPKELKGYTDEQIKADPNLKSIQEKYKKQTEERRLMTYFGKMSLGTLELHLNAVDFVKISDAQNTTVFPDQSFVNVKENRNFEFNGWINAGKMEINTLSATYNYKENKFNLLNTDESIFRVKPLQETDGNRPIAMMSSIRGVRGELYVDDPSNRSGQNKKITSFPKLKTLKDSYVFYNAPSLYRGAYDSARFYYTILPFELDSLDDFNDRLLRFKGTLTSAGIFPKINEDIKIMPDYSFGFSTKAPEGGLQFYGLDAKYDNKIILSNNGLQGAGNINFVQSTSISKGLTFLPDSTIGYAQFTNKAIEGGVEFPDVSSEEAFITYLPKKSMLRARSTPKSDLLFFNKEAKLRGTAIVTPKGMTGDGLMTFKTATTVSTDYHFKRWDIDADTSSFSLKNSYAEAGEDPLAFKADNVKAHISFKERNGEFISNKGSSQLNFPVNKYICRMDKFSWFMDYAELQLEKSGEKDVTIETDLDLVGPNFFSVHPNQDSLQFRAPIAKYDLKQRSIFCEQVEFIEVADARVYPDSMKVVVRKNAVLDKFENAKIVANYLTKYHTFTNVSAEITGRRKYQAKGDYPYKDKDSNLTIVQMKNISLDTSYQTIANGEISKEQNFKLSKEFDFYGKVNIIASNPQIFFNGATRIDHQCDKFERNWLSFSSFIDPKNIQIPVAQNMKNLDGEVISAGIVWRHANSPDSIQLYPSFLSKLLNPNDVVSITANGFLQYDASAKEFQIGSREKLLNRSEKGNFLALHTESCSLNGMGVINLGMDYGDVVVDAVGVANYDQSSGKTTMNLTAKFNMPLDKGMMENTAERINVVPELQFMDLATNTLEMAIVEWVDQKTADKFKSDFTIKGEIKKMPDQLQQSIVLTGLKLESFDVQSLDDKGLISKAPTAVLVNMYEKPVLKYLPIKAFFQQTGPSGMADRFGIFINVPGGSEYYFDYKMAKKDGEMNIISNDVAFNTDISGLKEDKRKIKNFKYQGTQQRIYLSRFLGFFER